MKGRRTDTACANEEPEVLYEMAEGVAVLTLNRPEQLNMLSPTMLDAIIENFVRADTDQRVRVVILTGKGRAFCAGMDLSARLPGGENALISSAKLMTNLDLRTTPPTVLHKLNKPVICALNGSVAGYGLLTALSCDIRIMAENAKMAIAFVKRGIAPGLGCTWLLPRLIGWSKAAELIFTGRTIDAKQAFALGLVSRIEPAERVLDEARALAKEIIQNAPLTVRTAKQMMRMGMEESFPAHMQRVFMHLPSS